MDFREIYCKWCPARIHNVSTCSRCPKYKRYMDDNRKLMSDRDFCNLCTHLRDKDMEVFCRTNRYYQKDSGEDFVCYRFNPVWLDALKE